MDDNFVETYFAEDHYFFESFTEKIKNLDLFSTIHIQSDIDEGLVF